MRAIPVPLTTLFNGSFHEVDSNDVAFKIAASMATRQLANAVDIQILEPVMRVEVITPEENRIYLPLL